MRMAEIQKKWRKHPSKAGGAGSMSFEVLVTSFVCSPCGMRTLQPEKHCNELPRGGAMKCIY
jgi:hypothetical protein